MISSDYRAAREDIAQDDNDRHTRINCPTLALWGEDFELVGRMWHVEALWREMTTALQVIATPRRGHLPHEEQPEQVNTAPLDFLKDWEG